MVEFMGGGREALEVDLRKHVEYGWVALGSRVSRIFLLLLELLLNFGMRGGFFG